MFLVSADHQVGVVLPDQPILRLQPPFQTSMLVWWKKCQQATIPHMRMYVLVGNIGKLDLPYPLESKLGEARWSQQICHDYDVLTIMATIHAVLKINPNLENGAWQITIHATYCSLSANFTLSCLLVETGTQYLVRNIGPQADIVL